MTRNRIIWLVLWILSLVGISFYGGSISYGLFFMLTLIPIISLLYLLYVYLCFRIYQKLDSRTLTVGQEIPYYFILKNEFPFAFAGIKVKFFSTFSDILDLDDGVEYELVPGSGIEKQTKLCCKYRGEYEVGIKSVEIQDYFRLFRISYKNKEAVRAIVNPRIIELDSIKQVDMQVSNDQSQRLEQEPDVIVRDYLAGDDLRYMHWGLSARNQKLMVRKQTGEKQKRFGMLMDMKRYSLDEYHYIPIENKLMELNLAIALYCANNNIPMHSCYSGTGKKNGAFHVQEIEGLQQFESYYSELSKVLFRTDCNTEEFYASAIQDTMLLECSTVFIISQVRDSRVEETIKLLNSYNIKVILYIILDVDYSNSNDSNTSETNESVSDTNYSSANSSIDTDRLFVQYITSDMDIKEVV